MENVLFLGAILLLTAASCSVKMCSVLAFHQDGWWAQHSSSPYMVWSFLLPYSLVLLDEEFEASINIILIQVVAPSKFYQVFQSNLKSIWGQIYTESESLDLPNYSVIVQQWKGRLRMQTICAGAGVFVMLHSVAEIK